MRPFVLPVAGFLLALGAYNPLYYLLWRFVPGFDLFRAPARWMELYAMGMALLAAVGFDALAHAQPLRLAWPSRRGPRMILIASALVVIGVMLIQQYPSWQTLLAWAAVAALSAALVLGLARGGQAARFGLAALLLVELVVASRALAFTAATAPMATGLRNSTAALLVANAGAPAGNRVLSLSDIRYDPGDLAELRSLQSDRIPPPAVERLVRAAKQVEVLAPNLPLYFRLPAVDGYDGGLLPLHRYVLLQGLFLDADKMTPDGRLAEQLDSIPDARLLDLTGVRYVITDKQRDLWSGDVYFDQEQTATIPAGGSLELDLSGDPPFEATGFDAMAASGPPHLATPITVTMTGGAQVELWLATTDVLDGSAPLPQRYRFAADTPARFTFRNTTPQPITLHGLSLVDERTGAHQSVTLSPRGDFRRIHSGDVKIYERMGALGRAWLVHGAIPVAGEDAAARAVDDPAFDPRASVVVEAAVAPSPPAAATAGERVETISYEAERALYEAHVETPGWLVIADAWYPGWLATVDGAPAEITRANLLYRAIALEPGAHRIELTYRPTPWQSGRIVSLLTLAALVVVVVLIAFRSLIPRLRRDRV
jgi:hypothetical protein